jgi:hypothetical protein
MEELHKIAEMGLVQTVSVIATVIGCAYYIHKEIQADRKEFRDQIKEQEAKFERQDAKFEKINSRIDRLYRMFYNLLKENK